MQATLTSSDSPCSNISYFDVSIIANKIVMYIPCRERKRGIVKTEDDSIPLLDPFPLPKYFPSDVKVALQNGQLPTKERRRVTIASSMLRFKRYPTRDEHNCLLWHMPNIYIHF